MFDIDKKKFGSFVAELRKEKGMTQKELAEKLFISDKAVSKWECGGSMPDITLLMPLAKIFEVTVPELLECRRYAASEQIAPEKADEIVSKVIQLSDEEKVKQAAAEKRKYRYSFLGAVIITLAELAAVYFVNQKNGLDPLAAIGPLIMGGLAFSLGLVLCFWGKEKLPAYYDENIIYTYSDGVFRMNIPGVHFNNSNWQPILRTMRIWSIAMMVATPIIWLIVALISPGLGMFSMIIQHILLIGGLSSLLVPIYVVGKKYE